MGKVMKISKSEAQRIFRAEAAEVTNGGMLDSYWVSQVNLLSSMCRLGEGATHIAFLGTSILARSVSEEVDLRAIKPTRSPENPRAYSARPLCHSVLVPLSTELGVHIGVTGKEPLNNQPYFRIGILGDGTPINESAREGFALTLRLVDQLQMMSCQDARQALRAFIAVRRGFHPVYNAVAGLLSVNPDNLAFCIDELVKADSEGGKRAQAAAAALFDSVYGPVRVECGRINDPSRRHPGDVCVKNNEIGGWEKAIEVRDKLVEEHDVRTFLNKCLSMGVRQAGMLMAARNQNELDYSSLNQFALQRGMGLQLFYGWGDLTAQVLFWSSEPAPEVVALVVEGLDQRLIELEVSSEGFALWGALTRTVEQIEI